MRIRWLVPALVLLVAGFMVAAETHESRAAVFDVPAGDVAALIAAINAANANAEADTINLAPGSVYTLTAADNFGPECQTVGNGLPIVTTEITINGNGSTIVRTEGSPEFRILCIRDPGYLTLNDVTLSGGSVSTSHGGGIFNSFGHLTLNRSAVRDSQALFGGGIFNDDEFFTDGTLTLVDSTVDGNTSTGGAGGGLFVFETTTWIESTTISRNVSASFLARGGGVFFEAGSGTIHNSTISSNMALGGGSGGSGGGGVYFTFGSPPGVMISNSTVTMNSAPMGSGGGVFQDGGAIHLFGSIVAGNPSGGDCAPVDAVFSDGSNLDGDGTCALDAALGDRIEAEPRLGPLQDNGGPTETHSLGDESNAIDAFVGECPPPAFDQRGVTRPIGSACDIGAYEREAAQAEAPTRIPPTPPPNLGAVLGPILSSDVREPDSTGPPRISPPNTGDAGLLVPGRCESWCWLVPPRGFEPLF